MKYHAPTKQFTISEKDLERFAFEMRYVIRKIREQAGLPVEGGVSQPYSHALVHAEKAVLDACDAIGVDLGASQPGMLDVREV